MNGWKAVAVIFIGLFILETVGFIYLLKMGDAEINKENKCIQICSGYDAYQYYENTCYCYKNNEIVLKRGIT